MYTCVCLSLFECCMPLLPLLCVGVHVWVCGCERGCVRVCVCEGAWGAYLREMEHVRPDKKQPQKEPVGPR